MNKTIRINLSVGSVNNAIRSLEAYNRRIERKRDELVEELVNGGAEMAEFAFGSTAVINKTAEGGHGMVEAVGKNVIIMEFGAGLSTMEEHPLKDNAPVNVYRWSYSREVGAGEGFITAGAGLYAPGEDEPGFWHFGGRIMSRVEPRHGMLDARDFIVENLEAKARSVFGR